MTDEIYEDPNITDDDKLWALLSYLITPIVPIIILLIEDKKDRPYLKSHYVQALIWGVIVGVLAFVLSFVIVGFCIGVAGFVMSIIWGIKAYNGEAVEIPVITDFVKKQGWA